MSVPRRDKDVSRQPSLPPINLGPKKEKPARAPRRVPLIGMSDALKNASAETGVTPSEFGTTSFTGTPEQTAEVQTRGVERLKRSITERAGGSQAAASRPRKVERTVEDRTSDSVIHPKLDRPVGSTPKAREAYRDAQIAKANKLGIPRSRVSILPPDADDYPETVAGPIPSRRAPQDLGEKIKRGELPTPEPSPGVTTRHTTSKVSADFDKTYRELQASLNEARSRHKAEKTDETAAAVAAAKSAFNKHRQKNYRRKSI